MSRAAGCAPITIRGRHFKCDPDHLSLWKWIAGGSWEPRTLDVFDRYLNNESIYYDIGAWIGPTVLYASRTVREVYAFEPDPTAYSYLLTNLRLNQVTNAHPFNIALRPEDGSVAMASFGGKAGDSQTSVLKPRGGGSTTALGLSWTTWRSLTRAPSPTFIKMDVEGAEFRLLPTLGEVLERDRPTLCLSTHAPYLAESERVRELTALRQSLSMYRTCMDDDLRAVSPDELLSPATQSRFRTFLFN